MTEKLEAVLDKVSAIRSPVNSLLIQEFYQYMVGNRKSDSYKKNNLKAIALFSQELARNITFYDIQNKEKMQTEEQISSSSSTR
jgi:serine acetyltransferase